MKKKINFFTHNYDELIESISKEVKKGVLKMEDTIYVLREVLDIANPPFDGSTYLVGYYPIVDWFYGDEYLIDDSKIYPEDIEYWEERQIEYLNTEKYHIEMTVDDCLVYMMENNGLLKCVTFIEYY